MTNERWLEGTLDQVSEDYASSVEPDVTQMFPQTLHEGHSQESVRTVTGVLDLLHGLEQDLSAWVRHEQEHGRHPGTPPKPRTIATYPKAGTSWRGTTYNVDGEKEIAPSRSDRTRLVVTNLSTGILYVSHDSGAQIGYNTVQIPPAGPDATKTGQRNWREFYTQGPVWAYPAVNGTGQLCDVQDEYGTPE